MDLHLSRRSEVEIQIFEYDRQGIKPRIGSLID
jgi:hypothetical protein